MLQEAAEIMVQIPGFEIDMTFKGIAGDVNELELVYFHPAYEMTLTLARIFTNVRDADGYEMVFDTIAETVKQLTHRFPAWQHIDGGSGWAYVLADFDPAQAMGLGRHLYKLDKARTPIQHLQHILVTCTTHYKRNIAARKFSPEITNLFWKLIKLRDKVAVDDTFAELRRFQIKAVDDLVDFYETPWVISSLSPAYTLVPEEVFNSISRTTNAGESAHANAAIYK